MRITWGAPDQRFFDAGLDRGVLYPKNKPAVAWNGLVSVDEEGSEEVTEYYMDGLPYLFLPKAKEYKATLSAYTYPDEFSELMGLLEVADGLYFDSQVGDSFHLSYRTYVGNGTEGTDRAYKIHLVYNAVVSQDSITRETLSDGINPSTFSWQIRAVPESLIGYRPTAHIVIDTRKMSPNKIQQIETLLYGDDSTEASMPTLGEVFNTMSFGNMIIVTDLGDGTFSVEGSNENVYFLSDDEFKVENANARNNGDGTFTIASTGEVLSDPPDSISETITPVI